MNRRRWNTMGATAATVTLFILFTSTIAQRRQDQATVNGRDITILVTVHAHSERSRSLADNLKPEDFSVREDDRTATNRLSQAG
jgi:hypothetical protein